MMQITSLNDTIFNEDPTALELLSAVAFLALFWSVFFAVVSALVRPLVYGKPWLVAAGERDYEHGGKELHKQLGMDKTKDAFVEQFQDLWPWFAGIIVQHLIGGMLCLPSILGIGDQQVAASLACLGILSEMGWEIQDLITWVYKRFGVEGGKEMVPMAVSAHPTCRLIPTGSRV